MSSFEPRRALAVPFLLLAACGSGSGSSLPRLGNTVGVDPLVLASIESALAGCEEGRSGALLELAKTYDSNALAPLALEAYDLARAECDGLEAGPLEYHRGRMLAVLGRSEEALAAFDAALALGDTYGPTHWRRGELLLEFGRLEEAREAFESALSLEPHSVPAHLGLARVLLLQDQPEAVLERLQPLVERAPSERFVHGLLARAQRTLGDEKEAARELAREERAQRVSMSDPRLAEVQKRTTGILAGLTQANEYVVAGQARQAVAILEPLHARSPENLALIQLYGRALTEADQHDKALVVLETGASLHPNQFKLELYMGLAFEGKKAHHKARARLLRARELNPAYGPTHAALGEVETKLGAFPEAEASLSRAIETGEDSLRTHLLLAQVQMEQNRLRPALETAEAAVESYPNAVGAWAYLAEARARLGENEGARLALAEAEKRNPSYERLRAVRALLEPNGEGPR